VTLDKNSDYTRQLDDYLMRRLEKMEYAVEDMRREFLEISRKLDKISEYYDGNKPSIDAIKSVLDAGGMLKWSVSTVVVLCAGFAAVITALEAFNKWFVK
jgi:hypothetical protein